MRTKNSMIQNLNSIIANQWTAHILNRSIKTRKMAIVNDMKDVSIISP